MQKSPLNDTIRTFEYPEPALHAKSVTSGTNGAQIAESDLPTPYLQLRARLSQALVNHWSIVLLLVLVRLVFASRNLDRNLATGLVELNAACREVQIAASTAVSMPHYLAQGTNAMVQSAIVDAVAASSLVLQGALTAVEAMILFFINAFKSTYLCLLELALTGTTEAVIDAVETIGQSLNATLLTLSKEIALGVTDANSALTSLSSAVQKAASLLGLKITLPTVNIPQISQLTQISIPISFNTELETIKSSISLDNVKNATDMVIEYPFERLKVLVNASLANYSFNQNLLNVPALQQLTFCDGGDLDKSFDIFKSAVFLSYHILIVLLGFAIVLAVLPHAYLEWWKWNSLNSNATIAQKSITATETEDPIDLVLIAANPLQSLLGVKLASYFRTRKSKNLARWFVSYITHPPVLLMFWLGVAGLLACTLQVIMLSSLERASPAVSKDVGNISTMVYDAISDSSRLWAEQTNSQILSSQTNLNKDLFGWIETSTTAVNTTLNTFTDELVGALNSTFGGTILYDPILKVLDCILLLKIAGIESGLTWVHDQAHISLPQVPVNTLAMRDSDASAMFSEIGSTSTERVKDVIEAIIKIWQASIRQEAIIAGSLLALWLIAVILALLRCLRDSRRTPTRTAFTSCFADDVKACISRPKAMLSATADSSFQGARRRLLDSEHMSETSTLRSVHAPSGRSIVSSVWHLQTEFTPGQWKEQSVQNTTTQDPAPHYSVHGILG